MIFFQVGYFGTYKKIAKDTKIKKYSDFRSRSDNYVDIRHL